jgi:hypothetical protein
MEKFKSKLTSEVALVLSVSAGTALLGVVLGYAQPVRATASTAKSFLQTDEKVISIYQRDDELIDFGDLHLGNVHVPPNRKFSLKSLTNQPGKEAEDWLQNLEFTITNRSNKSITSVVFEVQFPDSEINGPLMGYRNLSVGIPPDAPNISVPPIPGKMAISLSPGDKTTFLLSALDLQQIKDFLALRKFQLSEMNGIVIKVLFVAFDDGTRWATGQFFRLNPNAPGGFERIPQ